MDTLEITRDGVALHVESDGEDGAPTVVFLHGVTGSGRTWEWLPPSITDGRRIIRVDLRGHGRSGHAPGAYTVPDYAADIVSVLAATGAPSSTVLVGHSLGGVVSWAVAQAHRDRVGAAFLEDPPLFAPDMDAPENAELRARFEMIRDGVLAARAAGTSEADLATSIGDMPAGPVAPDAPSFQEFYCDGAAAAVAFALSRMDVGVVEGAIDGSTLTGVDVLAPVVPPVFVLAADERVGGVFRVAHADALARTHPQIEVVRVPGCGHVMHDERRHRVVVAERLAAFLARHAPVGDVAGARL